MEENESVIYADLEDVDGVQVVGLNIDLESNDISIQGEYVENPGKEGSLVVPKKKKLFTCLICTSRFSQNAGRYNHMKKIHNIYPGEKANVRCLEKGCLFTCSYKEKLQLHLSEQHGIDMDVTMKTFNSSQDFLRWKDEFERQEKSRFVKKSGSRVREEGMRVAYYYCSRSGTYVSHSKGMKRSKKKGTSKSSHHCTASITCLELPDGKVEVKICSTHYGHDNELQHLRLTQTEKFQIAEQLSKGIPRDLVLDNVRASAGSDVDRIHLITIKDVKNIEKAFGIQSISNEKTNDIFYNLNMWITNIMQSEHCPVLYFNEEGAVNTKSHDFTLILMTTGQLEVINKFCAGGIFYLSTFVAKNKQPSYCQNVTPSYIYVTTLMLVDDLNEAVPVSFMVTNNSDISKFTSFFESLKKKVPKISARAVLTDDRKEVYEVWCSVFNEEPYHLWSNRFVDSDWRENLICISEEEMQVSIYEQLYSYLESHDRDKLETTLEGYIYQLQTNLVTKKFAEYFQTKYIGSESMWAGCYGKQIVGVTAQLNMENVCNEVEGVGLKKHCDRNFLVRIVQHLLKIVSERHCLRQSKLQRQVQELPTHHRLALNVKSQAISQETGICWRVDSVKDPKNIYSKVTLQSSCSEPSSCVLYCSKCNICAHQFHCSCRVYGYDRTMCKHIHAVALNFFPRAVGLEVPTSSEECPPEIPTVEAEKELKNPELLLIKEDLWRKVKETNKKKRKPQEKGTGEEDVLPVIQGIVCKPQPEKRKRGRPRKHTKENIHKTNECEESEQVICKKKEKRTNKDAEQETVANDNNSSSSTTLRSRRINILRKFQKKC